MNPEINDLTELAYDGGEALTTTPVLGSPSEQPEPAPPAWWADALITD